MRGWRYIYLGILVPALVIGLGLWNPLSQADAQRHDVPRFVVDPLWQKPLPVAVDPVTGATKPWVTGEVAGTCVDSQDHVFTVNRGPQGNLIAPETLVAVPSPAVIEYDREGNVVNAWPPNNSHNFTLLPTGLHGCFVDHHDNVWIAGNGDGIVQKWSHDGSTLLLQIGRKGVCDNPPTNTCGNAPQKGDSKTLLNQPADIAVDPSNGEIYIADGYGNHRVVVFKEVRPGMAVWQRDWGGVGTGPGQFQPTDGGHPHCVVLGKDGLVYTCDRGSDRIQVFTKSGRFQREIRVIPGTGAGGLGTAGSAWDVDFSRDRNQQFMYDTDGGNEVLWIFDRVAGMILGGFGRPGHQAGEFTFLHTVATDSRGNLYTGETIGGRRIQKFKRDGDVPNDELTVFVPAGNPNLRLLHYNPVPSDNTGDN